MKKSLILLIALIMILITNTSCQAQLVKTIADMPKLKENEQKFLKKPLKVLIKEIKPNIISVLGSPEYTSNTILGNLQFYFIDTQEINRRKNKGEKPTSILVYLSRGESKKYPPLSSHIWTDSTLKPYENMIVERIAIIGKN